MALTKFCFAVQTKLRDLLPFEQADDGVDALGAPAGDLVVESVAGAWSRHDGLAAFDADFAGAPRSPGVPDDGAAPGADQAVPASRPDDAPGALPPPDRGMPLAAGEQGARDTQDGAAADSEVDADADASAEPYQVAAAGRGQRRGKPVAKPLAPEQIAQLEQHLKHPNVQAFLSLIANAEGATYDSRYGDRPGGKRNAFPDYSQYPVTDEKGMPAKGPAGRYQIAPETYGDLRQKLGLDDFSPHTQDLMAAQLLVEQGAMPHLLAGNFDAALSGAAPKWRSLARGPGLSNVTPPQQPYVPYERLRPLFDLYRAP